MKANKPLTFVDRRRIWTVAMRLRGYTNEEIGEHMPPYSVSAGMAQGLIESGIRILRGMHELRVLALLDPFSGAPVKRPWPENLKRFPSPEKKEQSRLDWLERERLHEAVLSAWQDSNKDSITDFFHNQSQRTPALSEQEAKALLVDPRRYQEGFKWDHYATQDPTSHQRMLRLHQINPELFPPPPNA